jgi:alkanesulfonate monooxygenase SsuD/methylene tetrahydromethanopterin reductase-like flavin-dependent oxidoreductase (luciferase family)
MLGVGFGYNRKEAADHGVPVPERARYVEETVRLMRSLWTDDEAEFEGRFRRISRSYSWPKPARPGGVPVLLGVRGTERNFERIVDWADGWIPMGNGLTRPELARDLADLRARWEAAGRASEPEVCCFFAAGRSSEMAQEVERALELGVARAEVYLEDRTRDDALPILDELGTVVAELAMAAS